VVVEDVLRTYTRADRAEPSQSGSGTVNEGLRRTLTNTFYSAYTLENTFSSAQALENIFQSAQILKHTLYILYSDMEGNGESED